MGFVVIVVLYASVGLLAALGSIALGRKLFVRRREPTFYGLFRSERTGRIRVAGFLFAAGLASGALGCAPSTASLPASDPTPGAHHVRYEVECRGECRVFWRGPAGNESERADGLWFRTFRADPGATLRVGATGTCDTTARMDVRILVDGEERESDSRRGRYTCGRYSVVVTHEL